MLYRNMEQKKVKTLLALLLISTAACTSESIYMKKDATVVKCGSPHFSSLSDYAIQAREAQCIQDYKEQGFVRVPVSGGAK